MTSKTILENDYQTIKMGADGSVCFRELEYGEDWHVSAKEGALLADGYQQVRDEKLGRWRSEDYTFRDFVVYPLQSGGVRVVWEKGGQVKEFSAEDLEEEDLEEENLEDVHSWDPFRSAAAAYLEWMEGNKSWVLAKPGELWETEWASGEEGVMLWCAKTAPGVVAFMTASGVRHCLDDVRIVGGRRVWPASGVTSGADVK